MLAKVLSSAVIGIDAYVVEVEVDIAHGLPSFSTVGLPEGAVRESKERVKAAVKNSGYHFPSDRVTVNLAPADIKKEGSAFDLPIALGILAATGLVAPEDFEGHLFLGELALDGMIRPVKGALSMSIAARKQGLKGIFLPEQNASEAGVVDGVPIFPVNTLSQVIDALKGTQTISPFKTQIKQAFEIPVFEEDFSDVKGQEHAKRALEIAAAGGHNLIMVGPPGSGKTMLARRISTILPPLRFEESLDTSKIYSVLGMMPENQGLITLRPFQAPHHTISDAGLIGGGQHPKPGQVSLAHNGVLFLDELPEFRRNVLEVLRQPMEEGRVVISRATATVSYPANFMLVAAMNPCPCGFLGDVKRECTCSPIQIQRYHAKISGPLLDRIDIHLEVPAVPYKDLSGIADGESSVDLRERVIDARMIQKERFSRAKVFNNASMNSRHLKKHCQIDKESGILLERAMDRFGLSARAHARILKIARTIADLEEAPNIRAAHVAEAIQYRTLDRKL